MGPDGVYRNTRKDSGLNPDRGFVLMETFTVLFGTSFDGPESMFSVASVFVYSAY
jgi:hypothetical protein